METFSHKLKEPRRKKCRVDSIGAELPILSKDKNRVCKGRLGDYRVLVDDWDDIRHIYCNGFFGKGLNSKGPPKSLAGFLKSNYSISIGMEDRLDGEDGNDDEPLVLSSCEAFFLSFALGCLVVFDTDNKAMSIQRLWLSLSHSYPLFPYHYATYHHFRSKGWVVRSGLKYAGDFVLYKQGPLFYHSTYNVIVCPVSNSSKDGNIKSFEKKYEIKSRDKNTKEESFTVCNDFAVKSPEDATNITTVISMGNNRNDSNVIGSLKDWASLCCLNRITEQVAKELLLVYIIRPPSSTTTNIKIKDFQNFEIKEVVVKRWASNKEREEDEL